MAVDNGSAPDKRKATASSLKAELETLRAEIATLETMVADRQTEARATLDREQMERHLSELLKMTADLMSARAAAAQLEAELSMLRSTRALRPWWSRMLSG
jgi:predicted RNase H-like nuclease (RuvC/YqgF family)